MTAPAVALALTDADEDVIKTIQAGPHAKKFYRLAIAGDGWGKYGETAKPNSDGLIELAILVALTRATEHQVWRILHSSRYGGMLDKVEASAPRFAHHEPGIPVTVQTACAYADANPDDATASPPDMGPLHVSAAELAKNPDLLQAPASLSPWLVWRGDLSLLVGREKWGKSTLAASDAANAARAGHRVLWITAEEGAGRVVSRFTSLQAPLDRIHLLTRWPQSWDTVERVIGECCPDAIYVDSLSSFLMAVDGDVPQTSEGELWQAKVLRFKRWTTLVPDHTCGVTVLVHATKADGSYRGSTGIGAAPDTIITMRDVGQDATARLLELRGRWGFPSKTVRFVDEAVGYVEADDAAGSGPQISPMRQKVLDALTPGSSWAAWFTAYAGKESTFNTALRWLKGKGLVVQDAKGGYSPSQFEIDQARAA